MKTKKPNLWYFAGPVAFVIVVWGLGWLNKKPFDIFNAITALFSGLAFAGLIYTLYQQHVELTLQRKELEDTRKELEGQKEQLRLQNEHFAQQNFEASFYNMLATQRQIIDEMEYSETNYHSARSRAGSLNNISNPPTIEVVTFKNRKFFRKVHEYFEMFYKTEEDFPLWRIKPPIKNSYLIELIKKYEILQVPEIKRTIDAIINNNIDMQVFKDIKNILNDNSRWTLFSYEIIFHIFLSHYDNYFSHLHKMLEFLKQYEYREVGKDPDDINDIEKEYHEYAKIIQSQMSSSELVILFYYTNLNNEMKEAINYFKLLEDIDKEKLLDPSHIEFYNIKKKN